MDTSDNEIDVMAFGMKTPKVYSVLEPLLIKAISKNGDLLQYVKDQIEEICLAAVKTKWMGIRIYKNQTEEICLLL